MDPREKLNWAKIKESLEDSGKTDNYFYERATVICAGGPDPLEKFVPRYKEDVLDND